jgi:hypothetical protein
MCSACIASTAVMVAGAEFTGRDFRGVHRASSEGFSERTIGLAIDAGA